MLEKIGRVGSSDLVTGNKLLIIVRSLDECRRGSNVSDTYSLEEESPHRKSTHRNQVLGVIYSRTIL